MSDCPPCPDAQHLAALLATDPVGLGGVLLRGPAAPARDAWLALLRSLLPPTAPWRRVPAHVGDERLLGGLDLPATLQQGRAVVRWGLLQEADGGLLVLAMAERLAPALAARIAGVLDSGRLVLQRDGLAREASTRFGVVALDEGEAPEEALPGALADRLAFHLHVDRLPARTGRALIEASHDEGGLDRRLADQVAAARRALPGLHFQAEVVAALCEAAQQLGLHSLRVPWLAWRVACAACALRGGSEVSADDAALAARLVLGPRALQDPHAAETRPPADADRSAQAPAAPPASAPPPSGPSSSASLPGSPPTAGAPAADAPASAAPAPAANSAAGRQPLPDRLLEAALASLPPDTLLRLRAAATTQRSAARSATPGRQGPSSRSGAERGRPLGVQPGELRPGRRLDLVQTLRRAAPWQALRRGTAAPSGMPQLRVRPEDFCVRRFEQPRQSLTIFAVDASGSQAMNRLAEAKGAVELLLADCYVRRDKVALLAFRGTRAELLLGPTRSLVRAKRCLAALPGGGGTPLAAGLDSARGVAEAGARLGFTPLLVLLTDGRANVGRQGRPGRPEAQADALAAARAWRATGRAGMLLDTALQPQPQARALAVAMGARYLALPCASARALADAVGIGRQERKVEGASRA